jgi:hypothetical protein
MLRCEKIQRFLANYSRIIMAAYAELCSRVRTQIGKEKCRRSATEISSCDTTHSTGKFMVLRGSKLAVLSDVVVRCFMLDVLRFMINNVNSGAIWHLSLW